MGELVAYLIRAGKTLESAELSEYKQFSELFDEDVYQAINLERCVEKRQSLGGTSPVQVAKQIAYVREQLQK